MQTVRGREVQRLRGRKVPEMHEERWMHRLPEDHPYSSADRCVREGRLQDMCGQVENRLERRAGRGGGVQGVHGSGLLSVHEREVREVREEARRVGALSSEGSSGHREADSEPVRRRRLHGVREARHEHSVQGVQGRTVQDLQERVMCGLCEGRLMSGLQREREVQRVPETAATGSTEGVWTWKAVPDVRGEEQQAGVHKVQQPRRVLPDECEDWSVQEVQGTAVEQVHTHSPATGVLRTEEMQGVLHELAGSDGVQKVQGQRVLGGGGGKA